MTSSEGASCLMRANILLVHDTETYMSWEIGYSKFISCFMHKDSRVLVVCEASVQVYMRKENLEAVLEVSDDLRIPVELLDFRIAVQRQFSPSLRPMHRIFTSNHSVILEPHDFPVLCLR